MPMVKTSLRRLMLLTGVHDLEKLSETLFNLKCEVDIRNDGSVLIEVQSDRIDMFSAEGIAYALKLYMGLEKAKPLAILPMFKVYVTPPIRRPFIGLAAVKGVKLDDDTLKELIEFQERLHLTYCRNRRKVAIGLHDLSKLPQNILIYKDVDIDSVEMVPLFSDKRMSIRDVLTSTEQGKLYGGIALYGNMHPAIIAGKEVISLPPVINSDITRLEPYTRDVLIDVTGVDLNAVINVLNVIVHTLAFYGGEVLGAEIIYPDKVLVTPSPYGKKIVVDTRFASKWLGIPIETIVSEGVRALQRMGYIVDEADGEHIVLTAPAYRCDILHQVDVVEDIAIGLRYDSIGIEFVEPPKILRRSEVLNEKLIAEVVREILIGLGYVEVNTLTLISSDIMKSVSDEPFVEIANALSKELNALRNSLLPSLLIVLRDSQYAVQPIKIFEIGEVVEKCLKCYNGWRNTLRAAFAIMDSEIRFEEIHADLYAILQELMLEKIVRLDRCKHKMFIDGRCGCIKYDEMMLGIIGEIHPEILKSMGLGYPVAMVELHINTFIDAIKTLKSRT